MPTIQLIIAVSRCENRSHDRSALEEQLTVHCGSWIDERPMCAVSSSQAIMSSNHTCREFPNERASNLSPTFEPMAPNLPNKEAQYRAENCVQRGIDYNTTYNAWVKQHHHHRCGADTPLPRWFLQTIDKEPFNLITKSSTGKCISLKSTLKQDLNRTTEQGKKDKAEGRETRRH